MKIEKMAVLIKNKYGEITYEINNEKLQDIILAMAKAQCPDSKNLELRRFIKIQKDIIDMLDYERRTKR